MADPYGRPLKNDRGATGYYETYPQPQGMTDIRGPFSGQSIEAFHPVIRRSSKMTDMRGDLVEKYKKKDGVPALEKGIQETVKRMRSFQAAKALVMQKINKEEEGIKLVGKTLLKMLPKDPQKDPQGMNFSNQGESEPDLMIRY